MSTPLAFRRKPVGRRARLALGAVAGLGLVVILATTGTARIQPEPAPAPVVAAAEPEVSMPVDPLWVVPPEGYERVGYRQGKRHVFEVVALGPTAVEVEISTARAFVEMREAALKAGVDLRLESGFRTVEQQVALFRAWRKGRGNKAARPGLSNHQSGRALDIAVLSAPGALPWLEENGASFGFVRTVKNEPWHWEFVDVPVARGAMKKVARKSAKKKLAKAVGHARRPASRQSPATKTATKTTRRAVARSRD